MAIVKATYTKSNAGAKASIRYIQHRTGRDGAQVSRTLFGSDGFMGRQEAYRMIDEAEKGSVFFRFVLSPDPSGEDTAKDLRLRDVTEHSRRKCSTQKPGGRTDAAERAGRAAQSADQAIGSATGKRQSQ